LRKRKKRKAKSERHSEDLMVMVPLELKESLKLAAEAKGIKPTEYVRRVIEDDLLLKNQITKRQN